MIKRITTSVRRGSGGGLFHDSREDCRTLMKLCIELIDKVNELVDEVNMLKGGK